MAPVKKKPTPIKKATTTKKTAATKKTIATKTPVKKAPVKKTALKTKASPVKKAAKPTTKKQAAPKKTSTVKTTTSKPKSAAPAKAAKTIISADHAEKLRDIALRILDERQAEDIVTVDLRSKSALADFAIIASGRSSRQLVAIADYLREAFMKDGMKKVRIEGMEQADWVLFDGGDVIIHLFRPEVRSYYHIEDIWSSRPTGK